MSWRSARARSSAWRVWAAAGAPPWRARSLDWPGSTRRVRIRGGTAPRNPVEASRVAQSLIPEDRKAHGLILSHSLRFNISLPNLSRLVRAGWSCCGAARLRWCSSDAATPDPAAGRRHAGRKSERWQPAKGRAGQVAGGRAAADRPGRTDARRRRRAPKQRFTSACASSPVRAQAS